MQFLFTKQTYYSFKNLPHCSCIPFALYITENFIDNNRPLFRHSCSSRSALTYALKQNTHLRTETEYPLMHTRVSPLSLTGRSQHTHTCHRFITSSLSLMLHYHLLFHNTVYDITPDLCSCAVFHLFHHISLFLVMFNSLNLWSKRETRLLPLVVNRHAKITISLDNHCHSTYLKSQYPLISIVIQLISNHNIP